MQPNFRKEYGHAFETFLVSTKASYISGGIVGIWAETKNGNVFPSKKQFFGILKLTSLALLTLASSCNVEEVVELQNTTASVRRSKGSTVLEEIKKDKATVEQKKDFEALAKEIGEDKNGNPTINTILGIELYEKNCMSCHGSILETPKRNRIPSQISEAIDSIKVMQNLNFLSLENIQQIALALSDSVNNDLGPKNPKDLDDHPVINVVPIKEEADDEPKLLDGSALYAENCAACHGALAESTKLNKSLEAIKSAIDTHAASNPKGPMGFLTHLSDEQINAISNSLDTATEEPSTPTEPTTPEDDKTDEPNDQDQNEDFLKGVELYAANCSSCHGSLATSQKRNTTTEKIINAIELHANRMVDGVLTPGPMGHLKNSLTESDIVKITLALTDSPDNDQDGQETESAEEVLALIPIGTYQYMATFANFFVGYSALSQDLKTEVSTIRNNTYPANMTAFGGFCTRYDTFCYGARGSQENQANNNQSTAFSNVRIATHQKFCEQISSNLEVVRSLVSFHGSNPDENPTIADLENLHNRIHIGIPMAPEVKDSMFTMITTLETNAMATNLRWQLLTFATCNRILVHAF